MNPIQSLRSASLFVMLVLATVQLAAAQVDDRARALLEGFQAPAGEVVDTLDQVMIMTIFAGGEDQVVRTRTIIDYVGERAAIDTEIAPGMAARVIIRDGQARMEMAGMQLPMPAMMADAFDGIFERGTSGVLPEGATATYDGVQAYGGLVEGEQVTITGGTAIAGIEDADETRMLFDPQGRLLAVVVETGEGLMLTVFDEPFQGNAVVGRSATMYLLQPGGPERFATMVFEAVRINEPIEDGTFD
jgi:hypothetical protein